ncbi:MAG TPA: serine/threonine-protein kinase, partial [Bryobacteraceae bacterium]|nr:serine/threonine-protein kinase [Bryobacteraceae bacterium]
LHGRCVVVKVLYRATGDPWAEGKFRDESAALSRIDHPGVVAVLDCGFLPEGQPFLVMQYVEGVTLRSVLEEGPMPLGRFSVIVYKIGQALAAAHAVGVVHRDLKPENIMLQKKAGGERVRLIDFGIASLLDPGEDVHHTTIAGTLAYMSPEQLGGKAGQASDIWTLGAICYEALTGKSPFAAGSSLLAIAAAKTKVPDKPSCFRSELPPEADELILSALDHEPENRPVDPARFGESLANSLISVELPVVPLARRPWAKAVIYALVLMITTGAATWYWQQMSVTGEITHKQRSVSTVNPDVRLIVLHKNGIAEDVRVDSTFRVDDQFRIGSRAPEAGNYYVLSEDLEKRSSPPALTLLYPAPSVSSFVPAGQEVQIPAQSWFMFDEPAKQRLWLVWSREAVPLLEEQRKRLNRVEGGAIQDPAIRKQVLAFLPEWGSPKGNGRIVAKPLIVTSH